MKYSKGFLLLVFFVGLLAGGLGGAVIGGMAALATSRGFEPPILSAFIPTLTPTVTLTATSIPTATPSPTMMPSPTATSTAIPTPSSTPTPIASATFTPTPTLMDIIEEVEPSVVTIAASIEARNQPQSFGSGVALLEAGVIVTNYHVVQHAQRIQVLIGDEMVDAILVGADFFTDIAVLQVDPSFGLKPLTLSTEKALRVGEPVFAIGSALGDFRNSVTTGIVSGLERSVVVDQVGFAYEMLIQTDAAINRGNSGGPLLNQKGDVVGINTLVVRGSVSNNDIEGLGFAIPATTIERTARLLLQEGKVARPFFGVRHEILTPTLARQYRINDVDGEVVLDVESGSPAAEAGIEVGDLLLSINGQEIDKRRPFINLLMEHTVGETIEVRLLRNEVERLFFVRLAER